jgi:spore coat polysaccharide biosynthesis protein SpsF
VGLVVQARMSSRRFPGKVLTQVSGRPVLGWLVGRLATTRSAEGLVVATSSDPSDDVLADWCAGTGVECHRGPLEDVAARMLGAADAAGYEVLVRLSGDSPFIDPGLVDQAVELWCSKQPDLVTNVWPRTFPKGQSVEVMHRDTLAGAASRMSSEPHREHVTAWMYDNADTLTIVNMRRDPPANDLDLCVDRPGDIARLEEILGRLEVDAAAAGVDELVGAARGLATSGPGSLPGKR